MAKTLFPLDIQLFAEEGAGAGGAAGEGSGGSGTAGASGNQSGAQIDYEQLADVVSRRTSAVSYTHLDVYKRQALHHGRDYRLLRP